MAKQDNTIWWILGLILVFIIVFQSGALKRIGLASTIGTESGTYCCGGFSETNSLNYYFWSNSSDCNIPEGVQCLGSCPSVVDTSYCQIQTSCQTTQDCVDNYQIISSNCNCYFKIIEKTTEPIPDCDRVCYFFTAPILPTMECINNQCQLTESCGTVTPHIVNGTNIAPNECCKQQYGCGYHWDTDGKCVAQGCDFMIESNYTYCIAMLPPQSPRFCPNGTWLPTGTDIYNCPSGYECVQNQTISECQEGEIKYSKCGEGEGFKQFIQATCSNGKWQYVVNVIAPCTIPCLQGYDYINQNCIKNETLPPTCPEGYVLIGSDCVLPQQPSIFQKYLMWFIIGGIILVFGYLLWEKGEGGFFKK